MSDFAYHRADRYKADLPSAGEGLSTFEDLPLGSVPRALLLQQGVSVWTLLTIYAGRTAALCADDCETNCTPRGGLIMAKCAVITQKISSHIINFVPSRL